MLEDSSPYEASYNPQFNADRRALGLDGPEVDFAFKAFEEHVCAFPWASTAELQDGTRMRATEDGFPDIPRLYVYYRINVKQRKVIFLSLSRAWSQDDLVPEWLGEV